MTELDIPTAYRRAADLLDEFGWCQHEFQDTRGRMCARGALRAAVGLRAELSGAGRSAHLLSARTAAPLAEFLARPVTSWNDDRGRTADEVKATLRAVAAEWEAGR